MIANPQVLQSSNAIPVETGYRIRSTIKNSTLDEVTFIIFVRQLDENGEAVNSPDRQTVPAGSQTTKEIVLTRGQLISVAVTDQDNILEQSEAYGFLELLTSALGTPNTTIFLTSGYISFADPIIWPSIQPQAVDSIPGSREQQTVTNPAAGAELSATIASNQFARLNGGTFTLDTDATVPDRRVRFRISTETVLILEIPARTPQPASQTFNYFLWQGGSIPTDNAPDIFIPIPDMLQSDQVTVETLTDNIAPGDQYSAITLINIRRIFTV